MGRLYGIALVVALVLGGAAVWWVRASRPVRPVEVAVDEDEEPIAAPPDLAVRAAPRVAAKPVESDEAARRRQRDELARRVAQARAEREAHRPADDAADAGAPTLDKNYINGRVRDIVPLIRECYDLARRHRPDLAGKVKLRFAVAGEPGVGGVVENAAIVRNRDGGVDAAEAALDECVTATVESLSFPAPPAGGRIEVVIPMVFTTDGPPAPPR